VSKGQIPLRYPGRRPVADHSGIGLVSDLLQTGSSYLDICRDSSNTHRSATWVA